MKKRVGGGPRREVASTTHDAEARHSLRIMKMKNLP